jgi:hypothetical protein
VNGGGAKYEVVFGLRALFPIGKGGQISPARAGAGCTFGGETSSTLTDRWPDRAEDKASGLSSYLHCSMQTSQRALTLGCRA